jgi:hypothetical protein
LPLITPAAGTDTPGDELEEVPLTILDAADNQPWHAQPSSTIDPREIGLFGPGVDALVTSEYDEDGASLPILTPSDDGSGTVQPTGDAMVIAAQKLREMIGEDRGRRSDEVAREEVNPKKQNVQDRQGEDREEPESEEEDDATRDVTWSAKKSKQVRQSQEAGRVAREASASSTRVKKTHGKSTVKVEEVFTYAPDREPDISNVRIVYVSDDPDEEVVSKVAEGKIYKKDASVKLPRINESDAGVDYTYLASTKTVSSFFGYHV